MAEVEDTAWLDLQQASSKLDERSNRFRKLKHQIRELQEEELRLREAVSSGQSVLDHRLQHYTKRDLQRLVNAFHARLPRQLRNHLYQYFCVYEAPICPARAGRHELPGNTWGIGADS
ncbi:hypothetical protein EJ02DRAFT_457676 [Clathrospora elynae]|uniref:Uncharacterized protein n=1 Tax=Clathrospora elynae TaxID=706981 RepID=A0A6A5SGB4_9PLEO|nr:hypothetical protein EJ02DRAFT_457676 [Clathrospora elynae]